MIGTIQSILVVAGIIIAVAGAAIGRSVSNHIQQKHPNVWKELGFPATTNRWLKAENESQYANAQLQLLRFVRTKGFRKLGDPRLNSLIRAQVLLFSLIVVILALFSFNLFVFGVGPNFWFSE